MVVRFLRSSDAAPALEVVARLPSAAASHLDCAYECPTGLLDLPLEILMCICGVLSVKDRVRLTSSCRTLWHAGQTSLWDDVAVETAGLPPWVLAHLGAWFSARRSALRRVQLKAEGTTKPLHLVLAGLGGPKMADLEVSNAPGLEGLDWRQLQSLTYLSLPDCALSAVPLPVAAMPALSHLGLASNKLTVLPPQLSAAAQSLCSLDLSHNAALGGALGDGAPLGPALWQLTGLTRLALEGLGLKSIPQELGCLPRLADLAVSHNRLEQHGDMHAAFEPVGALRSLTRLALRSCSLMSLPEPLSQLQQLQELELGGNPLVPEGWEPLASLRQLSRLDLCGCSLKGLPQQLSATQSLQDLVLRDNFSLGWGSDGGDAALEPLRWCTTLTRLQMERCGLRKVPTQLMALAQLEDLDLHCNFGLGEGGEEALAPLLDLPSLTALDLGGCAIQRLPIAAKLPSLRKLSLWSNQLGQGGPHALACLVSMPRLTALSLSNNGLGALPPQATALTGLASLSMARNKPSGHPAQQGTAALGLGMLPALRALTMLDLSGCDLRAWPQELRLLTNLQARDC
ncbi:hypothetical protein N2152v2_008325 [Parachlorella kessleri]